MREYEDGSITHRGIFRPLGSVSHCLFPMYVCSLETHAASDGSSVSFNVGMKWFVM